MRHRFVYIAIGLFIHRYDDISLDNISIFLIPDGPPTFIFRVEEYISSGKDKNIVNPDPNRLYTKRKQQRGGVSSSEDLVNTNPVATTSSDQV